MDSQDYPENPENNEDIKIAPETLALVLSKKYGVEIIGAEYRTTRLHGGTLGDVRLVTGTMVLSDGTSLPYSVVLKTQRKWERYGDPGSWRREYDLYSSDLGEAFSDTFRRAACYHAELDDSEARLWMEYVDGTSGLELTPDMYERAAGELGKFQGRLYANNHKILQNQTNLSELGYLKKSYLHYRSWSEVYDYIREGSCEIPSHLRNMIIYIDENIDEIFTRIEKLPVVFCHRDFWITNIFYMGGVITLIDWDTSGWGYMGEDIASLVADESDIENMEHNFRRCVEAYYKGFSEYADAPYISENCVYELILLKFGYRIIEWYKFSDSPEEKTMALKNLQKIYEIGKNNKIIY